MTSVAPPLAAWRALNARQWDCLALAYAVDQEHEVAERAAWSRGGPSALLIRLRLRDLAGAAAARAPRRPLHAPPRR